MLIALCSMITGIHAGAQGMFTWRTTLDSVKADGFYRIALTPELVAKCKAGLGDLRILGPDNQVVSYVLQDSRTADSPAKTRITLPGVKMVQKDSSNKHSYITAELPEAYEIDWISLIIRSPVFFKRQLQVLAEGTNSGEWTTVSDTYIDPAEKTFRVPTVKTHRLRIDIANADNAPLTIDAVTCFQTPRYLLTYLRAGSNYQLYTGNAQATTPDYDLKYFTDSLKGTPREISFRPLQRINSQEQLITMTPAKTGKEVTGNKDHSAILLWGSMLAVLLFLVYFSVRMVKAIAKKDAHDRI